MSLKTRRGAGLTFIENTRPNHRVLIGIELRTRRGLIMNFFGGMAEKDDISLFHTAVRETCEEILNIRLEAMILHELVELTRPRLIRQIELERGINWLVPIELLGDYFKVLDQHSIPCPFNDEQRWSLYVRRGKLKLCEFISDRWVVRNISKPHTGLNEIVCLAYVPNRILRDYCRLAEDSKSLRDAPAPDGFSDYYTRNVIMPTVCQSLKSFEE